MWERILQGLSIFSITKHVSKVCVGRCSLLALVSVCAPCLTPIVAQIIFVRKPRMLRVARSSDASNAAGRAAAGGGPVDACGARARSRVGIGARKSAAAHTHPAGRG
jgi:hypothetical protein